MLTTIYIYSLLSFNLICAIPKYELLAILINFAIDLESGIVIILTPKLLGITPTLI